MIYTPTVKNAMFICWLAHKSQVDINGTPYIFHPIHLAEQMQDEDTTVAALLHDVLEDSEFTPDDIRMFSIKEEILDALTLLTHQRGIPYMDYIQALKDNRIARTVKMADLAHNCDLSRLDAVTNHDLKRVRKYKRAFELLKGSANF